MYKVYQFLKMLSGFIKTLRGEGSDLLVRIESFCIKDLKAYHLNLENFTGLVEAVLVFEKIGVRGSTW